VPRMLSIAPLALVVALAAPAGSSAREASSTTTTMRTIATASTNDFRVVLRAARQPADPPTAVVTATTAERVGKAWRQTGSHRLAGPFFWNTLTGPRAVCELTIRTAGAQPTFRPYVTIQLLRTPALGCGVAGRYALAP
jgi:hypothetical protein